MKTVVSGAFTPGEAGTRATGVTVAGASGLKMVKSFEELALGLLGVTSMEPMTAFDFEPLLASPKRTKDSLTSGLWVAKPLVSSSGLLTKIRLSFADLIGAPNPPGTIAGYLVCSSTKIRSSAPPLGAVTSMTFSLPVGPIGALILITDSLPAGVRVDGLSKVIVSSL